MQISIGGIFNKEVEIAERKGIGHPDTICDEISEDISVALSKYYLKYWGYVMHHNVDKALLIGGQSQPAYGGGEVLKPMVFIIAGRATTQIDEKIVPVEDIVFSTASSWFEDHIPHLDVHKDVIIKSNIRPGSSDLVELFNRIAEGRPPLANDTSYGAGYWPLTDMEQEIIDIENLLNAQEAKKIHPFIGEDIKVMGYRFDRNKEFTVAIAMVDKYISGISDYRKRIDNIREYIFDRLSLSHAKITINNADNYNTESIYLTVTGTSAESGDDGQVGRGNRINGLITPYQPMSLEAVSGKNPISHVGKIYNYFARDLSRSIVRENYASAAQVFLVSQIGKPITHPQGIHLRLQNQSTTKRNIRDFVRSQLPEIANYWKKLIP